VVAGITSEGWPASVRNGGRFQIGIPAGINRNTWPECVLQQRFKHTHNFAT
jgi:hypothetical protein